MSSNSRRVSSILALFLVFAIGQVYIGASIAGPAPTTKSAESLGVVPQQPTGILTTAGNKGITMNGASAISGATVLSGAAIETPEAVGATINLGALGSIDVSPGTKFTLEFSQGTVRVLLTSGCVTLHTTKGTTGEVDTSLGVAGRTNSSKDSVLSVCFPVGATAPVVTTGSTATAGASAAGGGLFGLGKAATIAIFAGAGAAAVIIPLATRGNNPSDL
jgi:hypothetical protein